MIAADHAGPRIGRQRSLDLVSADRFAPRQRRRRRPGRQPGPHRRTGPGLYDICYVHAFQVQPGAEDEWEAELPLCDSSGEVVHDEDWGEAVLEETAGGR